MTAIAVAQPSLNKLTSPLIERLIRDAEALRIRIGHGETGAVVIDAGINCLGGIEAGRRITEICMGGLGQVRIGESSRFRKWSWHINVGATDPVLACLGSQLA